MLCPICESKKYKEVYKNFKGYMDGTGYDIFSCSDCNTQFIDKDKLNLKIYDVIYAKSSTPGYDRYFDYAKEVRSKSQPIKWLANQESTYYPIYFFLKNSVRKNRILEVGCGYGYLTYSLNKAGYLATGIDISSNAIKFAKRNFGNSYINSSIEDYKPDNKFDLIIATELIEHLKSPSSFIKICSDLLNTNGAIIVTAPNKDYSNYDSIWRTDLPPVHTVWLSKNSFKFLSRKYKLGCTFVDFSKNISVKENKLATLFISKLHQYDIPFPVLDNTGKPYYQRLEASTSLSRKLIKNILLFYPIRCVSNIFVGIFTREHPRLGVVLTKMKI